jgi:hypothetical protein
VATHPVHRNPPLSRRIFIADAKRGDLDDQGVNGRDGRDGQVSGLLHNL